MSPLHRPITRHIPTKNVFVGNDIKAHWSEIIYKNMKDSSIGDDITHKGERKRVIHSLVVIYFC